MSMVIEQKYTQIKIFRSKNSSISDLESKVNEFLKRIGRQIRKIIVSESNNDLTILVIYVPTKKIV